MSNYSLEIFREWIYQFHNNSSNKIEFLGEIYVREFGNLYVNWASYDATYKSSDEKQIYLRTYNNTIQQLYFTNFDFTYPKMISVNSKYRGLNNSGVTRTYYYKDKEITSYIQDYEKDVKPVLFMDDDEKLMLQFDLELRLK